MRFRADLLQSGKTATGIRVPTQVVAQLGSGKRPAVRVTLRGSTYRSTIAPMGGQFMLPVSAEIRRMTGVAAGDEVDVEVELDTEPREVTMPADFAEALEGDRARQQLHRRRRHHLLTGILRKEGISACQRRHHHAPVAAPGPRNKVGER